MPKNDILICHCGNKVLETAQYPREDYCPECNDFRCDIDSDAMRDCLTRQRDFQRSLTIDDMRH